MFWQIWILCNQMRVCRPVFESDWKLLVFSTSFEWKQNPVNEIRRKYPVIMCRPNYREQVYSEVLYVVQISMFAVLPTPQCKHSIFYVVLTNWISVFFSTYAWPTPLFRKPYNVSNCTLKRLEFGRKKSHLLLLQCISIWMPTVRIKKR